MRTSNIQHPTSNIEVKKNAHGIYFDVRCSHLFLLLFLTSTLATAATPSSAPVTPPAADNLELHEWSVFVIDGSTGQINPDGLIGATLPAFVTDHRYGSASAPPTVTPVNNRRMFINGMLVTASTTTPPPPSNASDMDLPAPVGVIRLVGSTDSKPAAKVDVSITTKGGSFIGSWPKAEERSGQLLWRDLTLSKEETSAPSATGPSNWFTTLRAAPSAYLSPAKTGCEKFLLYDLQRPYPSPLKIKAGNDFSLELTNTSDMPLHDLALYQGDGDSWRIATVGDLPATVHPRPATTTASTAPVTTAPSPAKTFHLATSATTQPSALADNWKPRMILAGVDPVDAEVIARLIQQYAFDSHRLTAIYRMDDDEFERILPLEVVPQPAKIKRFCLVIIVNADPSKGTLVDDLITQMGDNDWTKRDAAYHALAGLGPAAAEKLKTASKNSDLEIAWRAEKLLAFLSATK